MKASKIFLMICLAMLLLPASSRLTRGDDIYVTAGGGEVLKNGRQLTELSLDSATGDWNQIFPDGTTQTFVWGNGKSFVMTFVSVRFYADTTNTHPYRLFFKSANGTYLWIDNLDNAYYPTTGSNVCGGVKSESLNPGIVMTVQPTIEVRQLPVPPNNPNSGPLTSGTVYMRIGGYVVH